MSKFFTSRRIQIRRLSLAAVLLFLGACSEYQQPNTHTRDLVMVDAQGVILKLNASLAARTPEAEQQRNALFQKYSLRKVYSYDELLPNWFFVLPESSNAELGELIDTLQDEPHVLIAEPNAAIQALNTHSQLPDDPDFTQQLNLSNDARSVQMPLAWSHLLGSRDISIAVLDSGIDYTHQDLFANIWHNPASLNNQSPTPYRNEDTRGWNFLHGNQLIDDPSAHGTQVAGIIGADGNNGIGITGINWETSLMALKVLDQSGRGYVAQSVKALEYAINNGARVSNMSWGTPFASEALHEAIAAAAEQQHVIVTAAGNDAQNIDQSAQARYPAAYDLNNIITVGASNSEGKLASFSNFGARQVDLLAPGVNILTTNTRDASNIAYTNVSGTSFAAAHVTGVIGLMLSHNRDLTVSDIRQRLFAGVTRLPHLAGTIASEGILNAANVISTLTSSTDATVSLPPVTISLPASYEINMGQTLPLVATGGNGNYQWHTLPANAATIEAGELRPLTLGTFELVVTDTNQTSSSASMITVRMGITPVVNQLTQGEIREFTVLGGNGPYAWGLLADPGVARLISSLQNTVRIEAQGTGSFRLTATDTSNAGSDNTAQTALIEIINGPLTISGTTTTQLFLGDAVTLSASGGTPGYQWESSDTAVLEVDPNTGRVVAVGAGDATITLRDGSGIDTQQIDFSVSTVPVVIDIPSVDVIWAGQNLNSTQLTATGGNGEYRWESSLPGIASIDPVNGIVTAGDFIATPGDNRRAVVITARDTVGNPAGTRTIYVDKVAVAVSANAVVLGNSITLTPAGFGITTNNYSWTVSGDGSATIANNVLTPVSPGRITITLTDGNGNTASTAPISINSTPLLLNAPTTELWTGINNNQIQLSASGGVAPYRWSVSSNPDNNTSSLISVNNNGLVSAGWFDATVTDNRRVVTIFVTDTQNNQNSISLDLKATKLETPAVTTAGDTITLGMAGATPMNVSASPASLVSIAGNQLTANSPGSVTLTLTDGNGNNDTQTLSILSPLSINASQTTLWAGQNTQTTDLVASGGQAPYSWRILSQSPEDMLSTTDVITLSATGTVTANAAGIATIELRDQLGSTATQTLTVREVALNNAPASITDNQTISMTADGVGTISWSIQLDNVTASLERTQGTTNTLTGVRVNSGSQGSITVSIVDQNGNRDSRTITINAIATPSATLTAGNQQLWFGNNTVSTATISVSNGIAPFIWQVSGSGIRLNSTTGQEVTVTATDFAATIADNTDSSIVTVTDARGDQSQISFTTSQLVMNASQTTIPEGDSVSLTATGNGSVTWSRSNSGSVSSSLSSTSGSSITLSTSSGSGSVTVTATDSIGNTVSVSISVEALAPPVISADDSTTLWTGNSNSDSVSLSISGGTGPFSWNRSNGNVTLSSNSGSAITVSPSDFNARYGDNTRATTITVTDSLGKTDSISITVRKLVIEAADSSITEGNTVEVFASGTGSLSWSLSTSGSVSASLNTGRNPVRVENITGDGTLTVRVTDGLNNQVSTSINVNAAPDPNINNSGSTTLWVGDNSTDVDLTISGGTGPFSWRSDDDNIASLSRSSGNSVTVFPEDFSATVSNNSRSTTIRVTDSLGKTDSINITVRKAAISAASTSINEGNSVSLSAVGNGSLNWSISTSSNTTASLSDSGGSATVSNTSVSDFNTGTITVRVTDDLGNRASVSISVAPVFGGGGGH